VICPECGQDFAIDPDRKGRIPTYCSRRCQVRNLNRRRGRGQTIRITVDEETRKLLDRAAARAVVSTPRYVELLIAEHVNWLTERGAEVPA
jgi:hypothetical protein